MQDPDEPPFRVEPTDGRYHIVDPDGCVLVVCGDAANADQYAVLMNQAYARGFKAGLRKARQH
ncbi:MAG TPA: hypothetical protein VFE51_23950 [Verrucomicrobiae bacterium]|nr:hypothetical protein [Verrucomicrobiae bacterium]